MRDIAAVVPITLHHKCFGPEHFFGRNHADRDTEDLRGKRVTEPRLIHGADTIARTVDDVDAAIVFVGFAEPMRKPPFRAEAGIQQPLHQPEAFGRIDEQIEIFCPPNPSGVAFQSEGPPDQERDFSLHETVQGLTIDVNGRIRWVPSRLKSSIELLMYILSICIHQQSLLRPQEATGATIDGISMNRMARRPGNCLYKSGSATL